MKAIYLVALSLSVFLSACAGGTFQTAGQYESGKQALYAGNYPTALGYFQEAAQEILTPYTAQRCAWES